MIRVLLAGMKQYENQLTRAMEKYPDIEIVHCGPDPGPFDESCDLAVVATVQLSHRKFWDVKGAYKSQKKPILYCREGFTEIATKFENALQRVRQSKSTQAEVVKATGERRKLPREILSRIYRIIADCQESGMTADQTASYLKAEGYIKASGDDFTAHDIFSARVRMARNPDMVPPKPVEPTVIAAPEPEPINTKLQRQSDLIGIVIASTNLNEMDKLEWIRKVHSGEIANDEMVSTQVRGDELRISTWKLVDPIQAPSIVLTKKQARLLVKDFETIKRFAGEIE